MLARVRQPGTPQTFLATLTLTKWKGRQGQDSHLRRAETFPVAASGGLGCSPTLALGLELLSESPLLSLLLLHPDFRQPILRTRNLVGKSREEDLVCLGRPLLTAKSLERRGLRAPVEFTQGRDEFRDVLLRWLKTLSGEPVPQVRRELVRRVHSERPKQDVFLRIRERILEQLGARPSMRPHRRAAGQTVRRGPSRGRGRVTGASPRRGASGNSRTNSGGRGVPCPSAISPRTVPSARVGRILSGALPSVWRRGSADGLPEPRETRGVEAAHARARGLPTTPAEDLAQDVDGEQPATPALRRVDPTFRGTGGGGASRGRSFSQLILSPLALRDAKIHFGHTGGTDATPAAKHMVVSIPFFQMRIRP